ncbi:MAG: prenyltransferase/squalene oxidase repeat-containing protein, partial [Planctomycetaceae bacterium]
MQIEEDASEQPAGGRFRRVIFPYTVSIAVHAVILFALGFWVLPSDVQEELLAIISTPIDDVEDDKEEVVEAVEQPEEIEQSDLAPADLEVSADQLVDVPAPITLDVNDLEPAIDVDLPDLAGPSVKLPKGDFGGRSLAGRKERAIAEGGSAASEAAVVLGLRWLSTIQREDGSWNYTLAGESAKSGTLDNSMGATSMAVLAYLGAGHTNFGKSKYADTVGKGLGFLLRNAKPTADGLDMRGNVKRNEGMYVQGLGGIALTEAYGMALGAYMANKSGKDKTGNRKLAFQSMKQLKSPAQAALNFIARAQHPSTGGWRYQPRSKSSDTSVVGWQIMALQSGRSSRLTVPVNVMRGASHFLDVVAADGGAQYGYDKPAPNRAATTAVGLLCRMYLGWNQKNEALGRGVKFLAKVGPNVNNMYFNYYATMVLHHFNGPSWPAWNEKVRERLIAEQASAGHEAGSWYYPHQ